MKKRRSRLIVWGLLGVLIVLSLFVIINRAWVHDLFRGLSYKPSSEMSRIRDELKLTDRGQFLFNASQPVLSGKGEFNANCRTEADEEIAVLGCYTSDNIYVYDIDAKELDGIRELTTAHELLHAVWERMSEGERKELDLVLTKTFDQNKSFMEDEIKNYDADKKQEEIYVRAGTEVKDLPSDLEKHFKEIFKDQDLIVSYYEKYITVFREIEAEMSRLKGEMEGISAEISSKTAEYENRIAKLNTEIAEFNNCANTEGCFQTQYLFYLRRNELVAEQEALSSMHEEISSLVNEYNARVEKYNENVLKTEKLNGLINSNSKPEGIE
ncbi:hypothetical protein IKG33_01580 [Candidatus Saccharibacteria bacterium]|nr:hypothetical protein [Candidatus Saccharibacteria bacterium]